MAKEKEVPKSGGAITDEKKVEVLENKCTRLELLTEDLTVKCLHLEAEALMTKLHLMKSESELVHRRLDDMKSETQQRTANLSLRYSKFKEKCGVGEGHEINLATGEMVELDEDGRPKSLNTTSFSLTQPPAPQAK